MEDHPVRDRAITPRVIVIALFALLAFAPVTFLVETAWHRNYHWIAAATPSVGPIALLVFAGAIGSIPLLKRTGLSRRELLALYCILVVGGPLSSRLILFYLVPRVVIYYRMARAFPHWETTFTGMIPSWWAPIDPAAVNAFFDGGSPVPWRLWAVPGAMWMLFTLALWACGFCLLILIARQWITNERLSFPLAQVPLSLLDSPEDESGLGLLTRNRTFWIGAAIAFAVTFVGFLPQFIPALPHLSLYHLIWARRTGALAAIDEIYLNLSPWLLALVYLLPKEISFSVWFFYAIHIVLNVLCISLGLGTLEGSTEQTFLPAYYQGAGAMYALLLWQFWLGRGHLRRALSVAFGRGRHASDRSEGALYRWALIGFVCSLAFLVWFLLASGCRFRVALVFVAMVVGYHVLWARLRAESGLGFLLMPTGGATWLMLRPFGTALYRARELLTIHTMRWAADHHGDLSLAVSAQNALEGFKIADAASIQWYRLARWMLVGFAVSLVAGYAATLVGSYRLGFSNLALPNLGYWSSLYTGDGEHIASAIANPMRSTAWPNAVAAVGVGVAAVLGLGAMRLRFWWWPLHPIGFLVTGTWGMQENMTPFFIGWVLKYFISRYGGLRLYRRTIPFATGMIVGYAINAALWMCIAFVTKGRV